MTDYEFFTVSKIVGKYNEPIYVSFHWKTEDEVITGKPVEIVIETHLPYNSTKDLKRIEIQFNGIGYYRDPSTNLFERISKDEKVTLEPQDIEGKIFKSEPIRLRYAVEGPKSVLFCETRIVLIKIPGQPVSCIFDIKISYEISISKLTLIGTIGVYVLSVILVLYTVRLGRYVSELNKTNRGLK